MAALLNRVRQPFNVNAIAQAAAVAALDDREFLERCLRENQAGRERIAAGSRALGLECAPSTANFLLVKVGDGLRWFAALQRRGLLVRPLQPYGLPEWIRIAVGTAVQNERLLAEMAALAQG
jgi:histidinol-phosphate aminotransferase